jgi:uncharacterized lipoprotein YddW (UPF0748 family)
MLKYSLGWVMEMARSSVACILGLVLASIVALTADSANAKAQYRGMWVDAFHAGFLNASQTALLVQRARNYNYNVIFIENRKTAEAFHDSDIEPKAPEVSPADYDPLADLIAQAHDTSNGKPYIQVHAWLVAYRVATSSTVPPAHILSLHPEWINQNASGGISLGSSRFLDPGIPEVIDYTVNVAVEVVKKYDVDGIHYDYIRYPDQEWGYNPTSINRFNRLYGRGGTPSVSNPDWCQFRRDQVTALVRKTYVRIKAIKPHVRVSVAATTWGTYPGDFTQASPYWQVYQDWRGWMEEGILDMNCPMNYKRENVANQAADYRLWMDFAGSAKYGRHCLTGQAAYLHSISDSITQLSVACNHPTLDGTVIFSYATTNKDGLPQDDFFQAVKDQLFTSPVAVPDAPWLSAPTEGILSGTVKDGSIPVDGALVNLSGTVEKSLATDGTGFYALLRLPPANYTLTVSAPGHSPITKTSYVPAGKVVTLDFAFAP